jgi:hypothetical protein
MFTITSTRIAGLAAVVCAVVVAPQALAAPSTHSKKATSRTTVVASTTSAGTLRAGLNTAYVAGCANGTIGDRTMGGDNNNYDYYGDPCTS